MDFVEASVSQLYNRLIDAWNGRDSASYAQLFAENGNIVGFDGSTASGPKAIAAHLGPIFADHPTARYVTDVRTVREIAPGCALLEAVAGMIPPGKQRIMPERNAIQTLIAVREASGDWRIELFQNTPARFDGRPGDVERMTEALQRKAD